MTLDIVGVGDSREVTHSDASDTVTDGTLFTKLTDAFANSSFESIGDTNTDSNKSIRALIWDIRKFLVNGDLNIVVPRTMSLTMLINGYTIVTSNEFRVDGNLNLEGYFNDNANPLDSASYNLIIRTLRVSEYGFKQLEGATYFGGGNIRIANAIYVVASPVNAFSNATGTVILDRVWLQPIDRSFSDIATDEINAYYRSKKNGELRNVICSVPLSLFTVPVIKNFTLLGQGGVAKLIVNGIDRRGTGDNAVIEGINVIGDASVESTGSPRIDIINGALGTATPITTVGHSYEKQAGVRCFQDVQFRIKDIHKQPVEGAVIRLIQKKTGLETEFLSYCTDRLAQTYDKYDETTNKQLIYEWVSGADGLTNVVRVRLGYTWWNYDENSNSSDETSEGQKTVPQLEDSDDNGKFGAHLVGNSLDIPLTQLRKFDETLLLDGTALPILEYEHTEAEISAFTHYDTAIKLFEGLRYWEKTHQAIVGYLGTGESLVQIDTAKVTIREGWKLIFIAGNGEIQVNNVDRAITVPIGNGSFTGKYRLVVGGEFETNGVNVRILYEYIDSNGKVITSHHIYPTTDLDVIAYSNKQNIHIHAKHRAYARLGALTVFGKNGNQIVTNESFASSTINVGNVASPTGNSNDRGVKITLVSGATQITSFEVEDASGFNVGDSIYVSQDSDVSSSNLLELEDQIGQISHYFAYEKSKYYEVEVDIFGDIKRSINTYAELSDEITPSIEVIAGAEQIGAWRIDRTNGITVTIDADSITLVGDWADKSPEQLLWSVRESITDWNKTHPSQADKRYESDYFETIGRSIQWHKSIVDISKFNTIKTDIYDKFIFLDSDSALLFIDIGLDTETTTLFTLRIKGIEVGDTIGYIVNDESTYKILESADVSTDNSTILIFDKSETYKMRVRRKGFNEPLLTIDSNIRSIDALFYTIPNVAYQGLWAEVVSDLLEWDADNSVIVVLADLGGTIQSNIDLLIKFNQLFPQGVLGESLINTEYGFLDNILTMNYNMRVNTHTEVRTYHIPAVYEALAIQRGHEADGSPLWSYLESAEIDELNFESFVVHYYHAYTNTVLTAGTKALLDTQTLAVNVKVLLGDHSKHFVDTVIEHTLDILQSKQFGVNSGTMHFEQGVPDGLEYNKKYKLFHKVSDAQDDKLEVVVYNSVRTKVQFQALDAVGELVEVDEHISWGAHKTLQGGFDDDAKANLEETKEDAEKALEQIEEVEKNLEEVDELINSIVTHTDTFDTEYNESLDISERYLLLKQNVLYGDIIDLAVNFRVIKYAVFVSDGGVTHLSSIAVIRKMNEDGTLGDIVAEESVAYMDRVNQRAIFTFDNILLEKGKYFIGYHGEQDNYHATIYEPIVGGRGYYTVNNTNGVIPVKTEDRELVASLEISTKYSLKDLFTLQEVIVNQTDGIRKGYKNKSAYVDDLDGTNEVKQNEAKAVWTYEDDGITVYRKVKFLDKDGNNVVLADATSIEEYT